MFTMDDEGYTLYSIVLQKERNNKRDRKNIKIYEVRKPSLKKIIDSREIQSCSNYRTN